MAVPPPSDDYAVKLRRVAPGDVQKLTLSPLDDATMATAGDIVRTVRDGGEAALLATARRFGDLADGEPYLLDRAAMAAAYESGKCGSNSS